VFNVFSGSSGYGPWLGSGGSLIPPGAKETAWIPATATQMPSSGTYPAVLDTHFFAIVPGGFAV